MKLDQNKILLSYASSSEHSTTTLRSQLKCWEVSLILTRGLLRQDANEALQMSEAFEAS